MAIEAFKRIEPYSITFLRDQLEVAKSNLQSAAPGNVETLMRIGHSSIDLIISRLEKYPAQDPNASTRANILTEITGKSFLFDNSNPEKWKNGGARTKRNLSHNILSRHNDGILHRI